MQAGDAALDAQIKLANYIKNTHQKLRSESNKVGFEQAWKNHCNEEEALNEYAECMRSLATEHWGVKNKQASTCRISWIHNFCTDFFPEGQIKFRMFELHKLSAFGCEVDEIDSVQVANVLDLLDVGSCYNPFENVSNFRVLPIDIAPANSSVKKCDFLQLEIVNESVEWGQMNTIDRLSKASFDVVIFSLLLEYFPNSELRFKCCKKAHKVLKPEGLLIIITPDSKHATANAKIMKKWKFAMASLGFWRVKYEKLTHLHCMAFCKSKYEIFPKTWLEKEIKKLGLDTVSPSEMMIIPQDFNNSQITIEKNLPGLEIDINPENAKILFSELPLYHA